MTYYFNSWHILKRNYRQYQFQTWQQLITLEKSRVCCLYNRFYKIITVFPWLTFLAGTNLTLVSKVTSYERTRVYYLEVKFQISPFFGYFVIRNSFDQRNIRSRTTHIALILIYFGTHLKRRLT